MTKILSLIVLSLVTASFSFASDSAVAANKTKRVRCQNGNSFEPYLRVRGTLQINSRNEASGMLAVETDAVGGYRGQFAGYYTSQGRMEFVELTDTRDRTVQIYIDFTDDGLTGKSYIESANGFQRMVCNAL